MICALSFMSAIPPSLAAAPKERSAPMAVGVDLSLLDYTEAHGVRYKVKGAAQDPLKIFKSHGVNFVRLRLFVHPSGADGQVNDLPYTLKLAKRVKKAGLKLLLDFHYSDGWCDPQNQATPARWKGFSASELAEKIHGYTADVIRQFGKAGCMPDLVQTGNEITNGMLWPTGVVTSDAHWDTFAGLLKSAIQGARDGGYHDRIMIHIDRGGDWGYCRMFYENLDKRHVPYDIIGLSYYPFWQGTLANLKENMNNIATHFHKDVMVAETGDEWRGGDGKSGLPATPDAQLAFLNSVFDAVRAVPDGHGIGVFYWGAGVDRWFQVAWPVLVRRLGKPCAIRRRRQRPARHGRVPESRRSDQTMNDFQRISFGRTVTASLCLLALTGCGAKSTQESALPVSSLPANQIHGDVQVWSWDIAAKSLQDLTPAFERAHPHERVTVDQTGAGMLMRLMLSLASGTGAPDITQMEAQDAPRFIGTGQLADLTPVAAKYQASFPPSVWANCSRGGHVYAIPWDIGPCAVYYKRDLFAKYGIDPSKISTWDDYIEAGRTIVAKSGGKTKMLPMGSGDLSIIFELLIQQTGGQIFDAQGRIAVDSPQSRRALEIIAKMRKAGICSDSAAYGQEWMSGFNDESIATYPGAEWLGGIIKDSSGPDAKKGRWGVFRLPAAAPGGVRAANLGGSVLAIPAQCPNKNAAWAFIEYALCTREGQLAQYRDVGLFPAYLPALQSPAITAPDPFFGGQESGRVFAADADMIPGLNRTANWSEGMTYLRQDLSRWAASGMNDPRFFPELAAKLQQRLNVPMAPHSADTAAANTQSTRKEARL